MRSPFRQHAMIKLNATPADSLAEIHQTRFMENNDPATANDFDEIRDRAEAYIREEPSKAVGIAVAAGIFLTIFPVGRLLFALVRLALALVKPALLIFGGVKAYEEIQKRYGA